VAQEPERLTPKFRYNPAMPPRKGCQADKTSKANRSGQQLAFSQKSECAKKTDSSGASACQDVLFRA